jgi:hypothetical protein
MRVFLHAVYLAPRQTCCKIGDHTMLSRRWPTHTITLVPTYHPRRVASSRVASWHTLRRQFLCIARHGEPTGACTVTPAVFLRASRTAPRASA